MKEGNAIGRGRRASSVAASCGLEKCFKALWPSCLLQIPESSFIGRSHSTANREHRNYCAMFGSHSFKPAHFWGRQLAHLLNWLDSLWVLHRTKWKQHTIAQKKSNLEAFAWRAQHSTRLWTGCNGSSFCKVLVWCCKPPQTMSLTRLLRTKSSAWAHLKAQIRDPIRLATGFQKEVSCNSTWIHCQLRVRQQTRRQATL